MGQEKLTGNGDVGGGLDGRGGSQVGGDTDRLEDGGDLDERPGVGDGELVAAERMVEIESDHVS